MEGNESLLRKMATSEGLNGSKARPCCQGIRTLEGAEKVEDGRGLVESPDAAENIAPADILINAMKINITNSETMESVITENCNTCGWEILITRKIMIKEIFKALYM